MNVSVDNGEARIQISGRIDSVNAPAIEKEIWEKIDFCICKSIVVDAENLEMISSAGLRIALKLQKSCHKLRIVGVNPDVYEVFDMTGFTEIMQVEKAYRRLSVDGCEVLGEGSNGIVYRYDPEIVIKVYRNADALTDIKRERELARRALILGIPTAIPFDTVKVGDLFGSVFELLNAKSLSELIAESPERTDELVGVFAELLKKLHSTTVESGELGDMKKVAAGWAEHLKDYLPSDKGDKLVSLIETVPESNTMIHGDYHTNNVEMQNGEVLLIDMDTLSFGHPVFELGSMFLAFVGFGERDHTVSERFLKLPFDKTAYIWRKTLELYFDTTDDEFIKDIEDKARVIGYARLLRRTIKRIGLDDPGAKAAIEYYTERLNELLAKVDSLDFEREAKHEAPLKTEITLKAAAENIHIVTDFVERQLVALNCPLKAQTQISIAIDELFGNIANYAYNPKEGMATVCVEVEQDPLAVIITFMDGGVPYDPLQKPDPDITLSAEERDIGGLGIFLVKKSMDDITYEYKDGQNILKIKKNI